MSKKYFTLVTLENVKGVQLWCPQYGSYDKMDVEAEKDEYPRRHAKIIKTENNQKAIDEAVAELNKGK